MEVGIKVVAENIQAHLMRHANSCFFTMVAVDEEWKANAGAPSHALDSRRAETLRGAKVRKELRREIELRH